MEFWTASGPATGTFDPSITTSISVPVTCFYGDGTQETLTGTAHAFSHTYAELGLWRAIVRVQGGLGLVTAIDFNSDLVTKVNNLCKLSRCTDLNAFINAGLVMSVSSLPDGLALASFAYCSLLTGLISNFRGGLTYINFSFCPFLTGLLSNLLGSLTYVNLSNDPLITFDSIAQLTVVSDIRISSCSQNQAAVDAVIDSIYQAVLLDANHFTAAAPALQIQANNAAPSGVYQETVPPVTGLEKVWYLCHLGAHPWTITWNGGSGP
jgi:xanthine/uracil/vitamin C permease (AzgA family)